MFSLIYGWFRDPPFIKNKKGKLPDITFTDCEYRHCSAATPSPLDGSRYLGIAYPYQLAPLGLATMIFCTS